MYGVELYGLVRRTVTPEGLSQRATARRFGIDRGTVAKMMANRKSRKKACFTSPEISTPVCLTRTPASTQPVTAPGRTPRKRSFPIA